MQGRCMISCQCIGSGENIKNSFLIRGVQQGISRLARISSLFLLIIFLLLLCTFFVFICLLVVLVTLWLERQLRSCYMQDRINELCAFLSCFIPLICQNQTTIRLSDQAVEDRVDFSGNHLIARELGDDTSQLQLRLSHSRRDGTSRRVRRVGRRNIGVRSGVSSGRTATDSVLSCFLRNVFHHFRELGRGVIGKNLQSI
mmetsp:Transcript_92963/g.182168  ORF Transcript_92963/g.182168 Transcript_92963/m.182168 type:complete len:200 (-) Transcript_92963:205-804(-)